MIDNKKILAIIPARGGSKGIPKKNIKAVSGKPMINYTIEAAKECEYIDKVIVSTDDEEIAEISMRAGAIVPFLRPDEMATDEAPLIDVVMHAVEFYERKAERYDIILLLQPTSPLRTSEDIQKALEYFIRKGEKPLASVSEVFENPTLVRTFGEQNELKKIVDGEDAVRRQDMKKFYRINGAIYINSMKELNENTNFHENLLGYVLPREHSVDVDEPQDIVVAEYYLSQKCDGEFLSFIVY
jgi:CMP-N-acetylneuraminic acid synthetase